MRFSFYEFCLLFIIILIFIFLILMKLIHLFKNQINVLYKLYEVLIVFKKDGFLISHLLYSFHI